MAHGFLTITAPHFAPDAGGGRYLLVALAPPELAAVSLYVEE